MTIIKQTITRNQKSIIFLSVPDAYIVYLIHIIGIRNGLSKVHDIIMLRCSIWNYDAFSSFTGFSLVLCFGGIAQML